MKIALLALDKENKNDRAYRCYERIFSFYAGKEHQFKKFNSAPSFFQSFAEEIKTNDTLVLTCENSEYLNIKQLLFKSLKIQTDVEPQILSGVINEDSQSIFGYSYMPRGAAVLFTKSKRYCGFIKKFGSKTLVFLPLDNECSIEIEAKLASYFIKAPAKQKAKAAVAPTPKEKLQKAEPKAETEEKAEVTVPAPIEEKQEEEKPLDKKEALKEEKLKEKELKEAQKKEKKQEKALRKQERKAKSQAKKAERKMPSFNLSKKDRPKKELVFDSSKEQIKEDKENKITLKSNDIKPIEVIKKLKRNNINVAVASSKYSDFIFLALTGSADVIYPYPTVLEKSDAPTKTKLAAYALKAKNKSHADLGISISNVFYSDSDKSRLFIFICAADSERAHVFKIHSTKGQNAKEFLKAAISKLYKILDTYAEIRRILPPEKDSIDTEKIKKLDQKQMLTKITATVLSICLLTSAIFTSHIYINTALAAQTFPVQNAYASEYTFDYSFGLSELDSGSDSSDTEEEKSVESSQSSDTTVITEVLPPLKDGSSKDVQTTVSLNPIETTSRKEITTLKRTTTTKKPTVKPTFTSPSTTKAPTNNKPTSYRGTFTFTVYGYGHGVGMSQNGAITFAKQNWGYASILKHYYFSDYITIETDSKVRSTATYNGKSYPMVEYLCKIVAAEIGPSSPVEALKAQAVAAYTYAKAGNFNMNSNNHAFRDSFSYKGTTVEAAVRSVLGKYVAYKGEPATCYYFATAACKTTSSQNVWIKSVPYLQGGRYSPEDPQKTVFQISSDELKKRINAYNENVSSESRIALQSDPAQWIQILSHDKAVNSYTGYVAQMQIGNKKMKGNNFRFSILGGKIRSHCFNITYTPYD